MGSIFTVLYLTEDSILHKRSIWFLVIRRPWCRGNRPRFTEFRCRSHPNFDHCIDPLDGSSPNICLYMTNKPMNLSSKCLHSWFLSNFILSFQTNLGKTMVSPFRTTYKLKFWFWSLKSTVTVHTPRGAILSPEYVLRLLSVYNVYLKILSVYLVPTWLSSAGNNNGKHTTRWV